MLCPDVCDAHHGQTRGKDNTIEKEEEREYPKEGCDIIKRDQSNIM